MMKSTLLQSSKLYEENDQWSYHALLVVFASFPPTRMVILVILLKHRCLYISLLSEPINIQAS